MVYGTENNTVVFEKEGCVEMTWRWYYENFMWMLKGYPIPPADARKKNAVIGYAKKYGITILVETGTYLGQMVNDTKDTFEFVYSIELDKHLHVVAEERFKDCKNVHLYRGDSAKMLPVIIRWIDRPILFWLDAHYSGGNTTKTDEETPILSELRSVLEHPKIMQHVILIDDARLFENPTPGYPSVATVREIVRASGNRLSVFVADDIIRIVPSERCGDACRGECSGEVDGNPHCPVSS